MGPSRRSIKGGVLWDAFLILLLCGGAFWVWRTRDRWKGMWTKIPGVSRESTTPTIPVRAGVDLERRSAAAQAGVRQFLSESGVNESNILKSYNQERREGTTAWLESTLELSRPSGFRSGVFLKRLLVFLSRHDLALMRDEAGTATWTLEVGDRTHVFQRIVIRTK